MFGKKLKEARLSKNLKQSELAEKLAVRNTTISNWEKGISNPDIEIVSDLCLVLDIPASFFFDTNEKSDEITLNERGLIKKYRSLDDYGKKQIDNTLELEYKRVQELDNVQFTTYDDAMNFLTKAQMFAFGGLSLEDMEEKELIEFANDQYEMEKKYLK